MLSLGRRVNYIRLSPNFGFRVKVWPKRYWHFCRRFKFALLKPDEFCRRPLRPKRRR